MPTLVHRRLGVAALPGLVLGLLTVGACQKAPETAAPTAAAAAPAGFGNNPYCTGSTLLCSTLPGEQILVPQGCQSFDQQCSRDFWSWQNFVSLNWPGKIINAPEGVQIVEPDPGLSIGGAGSRVWELWMDPDAVFLPGGVRPSWQPGPQPPPAACAQLPAGKGLVGRLAKASVSFTTLDPNSFFEATVNQPLIDQAMNFVVFEIRMNQAEVGWVVTNTLYQQEVVQGLTSSQSLSMPPEPIETKAAWRILPSEMPEAQKNRYYRVMANILLDPQNVEGGGTDPVCIQRELGLIGLHIRHNELWSTFEQVDNVSGSTGITPTLFNPACTTCAVNVPPLGKNNQPIPASDYKWSLTGPSASLYTGFPNVPSQITRAPGQDESINFPMNAWWQNNVLQGTVWANYMLITTNWIEEQSSQPIPALNTSMEPYIPTNPQFPQACIDCHNLAQNKNGAEIARTFLPFRACPTNPQPGQQLPPNCVVGEVDTLASHR